MRDRSQDNVYSAKPISATLLVCAMLTGCGGSGTSGGLPARETHAPLSGKGGRSGESPQGIPSEKTGPENTKNSLAQTGSARPVAMIDGRSIDAAAYQAMLAENSGGIVLEELILESALVRAIQAGGLTCSQALIDAERVQLADSLARATGASSQDGERLIESVRRNRGLGPVRYQKLLERNAMLRLLVRQQHDSQIEQISEEDVKQAYAIRFGPRVRARLILLRTLDSATKALSRVRPAPGGVSEPFGEVASQMSVDPTSARGGLMDPISVADPNYPVGVRRAIESLAVGDITQPIAVSWPSADGLPPEQGYAIIKVEEQIPASGPSFESVSEDLRAEVRLVRERAAMDRMARALIEQGSLKSTVFDPSLDWSWSQRQRR